MSGIYIKGMEMPVSCYQCWIPCEVPFEDRNHLSRAKNCPATEMLEQKKGKWIERAYATTYDICGLNKKVGWGCSECGFTWDAKTHYCPKCGADMRPEHQMEIE